MPYITENTSLKEFNTFGVDVRARYLMRFVSPEQIIQFLTNKRFWAYPWLILGGGSNLLFTRDFSGVVLRPDIRGIEVVEETDEEVLLRVGAGEVWDDLVDYATRNAYAGLENLSDIPGSVGAAPVQNIGAYGVEVKDVVEEVSYVDFTTITLNHIPAAACQFAYRDSLFKHALKDKAMITHVSFRLKKDAHAINLSYAPVAERIAGIENPDIQDVRACVRTIRGEKLPGIKKFGNAGSFFKNPLVSELDCTRIKDTYPDMPAYRQPDGSYKLSAAWLIEKTGWKGRKKGQVACYEKQPLVLVNRGRATGEEILKFAEALRKEVEEKFAVTLQTEVNIL